MKNKFLLKGILAGGIGLAAATYADAQGLENVIVERYYVSDANDATDTDGGFLPVGSVTYRIFIDLLPGHELLSMYGSPTHELRFETTTSFFNNEDRGAVSAKNIPDNQLGNNTVLLDSYLTLGAGSNGFWGVPKANDTNGAIANGDGFLQNNSALAGIPLTTADGLIPGPGVPPSVVFVPGESIFSALDNVNAGPVVSTFNAAWAVLEGTTGPTAANQILIAQITTDGIFSFELNMRIGNPNGSFTDYVAKDAIGNELVSAGLTFTSAVSCSVDGGTITSASPRMNLCIGDGFADVVSVSVSGNIGEGIFGLVRSSTGEIVATNTTGNFNMETFAAGNYLIGRVSVNNLSQLIGITNISQLSGCFDLSNTLTVSSFQLTGGTITANGSTTVCNATLTFSATGTAGPNFIWVLLNSNGTEVLSQNATGVFNFASRPAGTYRVTRATYGSSVNLGAIMPPQLPACIVTSNIILVTKVNCAVSLESSPNPTSGISNVSFSLPAADRTTLEVYDMSGRQITTLFNQVAQSDVEYRMEFDGLALPNGVYIYRLTSGSDVVIEKFMIAK